MKTSSPEKTWAGYLAPREELLPHVRQVLLDLERCSRIHYSFTSPHPLPPERHAVNFHFCLTWLFNGFLWASAAFERHWERRVIQQGELFLSGTGGWYEPDLDASNCTSLSILFYPRHTRLVYADIRHGNVVSNPYYHTAHPTEGIGQSLLGILNQLLFEKPQERHERTLTVTKALLQQLIRDVESDSTLAQSPQNRIIAQISTYCQQCFHLPINVAYVCNRLHINCSYASELFHQKTGQMLKDYLLQLRLEKAEWLLKYDDRSMEEIAQQCGFSGANYFVRTFHKAYGVTPGSYRRNQRDKTNDNTR